VALKKFCCVWIFYYRLGHEDCARGGKALHAGSDVHGLPEIVLAVIETYGETWSLVDADLEKKILVAPLGIDVCHRLTHPQRRRKSAVWRGKGCHHGIADGLDDRARFGRHDLVQYAEMLAHEIVSDQITYALIECRRALEIGEQESEAGDLEPLIGVERVGVIKIAKCLIGEESFRGKERPPLAEQRVQLLAATEGLDKKLEAVESRLVSPALRNSDDKYFVAADGAYLDLIWLNAEVGTGGGDVAGGADFAPTDAQLNSLQALEAELTSIDSALAEVLQGDLPPFNQALQGAALAPVAGGAPTR